MEGFQCFLLVVVFINFDKSVGQPLPYILTSPYQIHLEKREVQVYNSLKSYKESLNDRLKLINQYLQDYEECQNGSYSAQENPMKATRMIRRFPKYVTPIKNHLKYGVLERRLFKSLDVFSTENGYQFPGDEDYLETMEALLSLQYMYNLKPLEIMNGVINGVQTGVGFTARQSLEIAAFALQSKYFTLSYEWLRAAREKDATKSRIIEKLEKRLIAGHDEIFETEIAKDEWYIYTSKLSNRTEKTLIKTRRDEMLAKWGKDRNWVVNYGNDTVQAEHYSYLSLCNGQNSQTLEEKKELKCWLSFHAFKIFPVKVELLSLEPELLLFHDVVPDTWIEIFTKKAEPVITEVNVNRTPERLFNGLDSAWFAYDDIPILAKIESLTGLRIRGLNGPETLKVGVYGKGGRYQIHQDAVPGYNQDIVRIQFGRDSLQIFLIYMTDVELGGATVFPPLGISVFPKKGSALYWSNIDVNGDPDVKMLHAPCPVLLGKKWIANYWIGLLGNGHGRNCSVNAKPEEINAMAWDTVKQHAQPIPI